jgi:Uma2 family endonuclease
VVWEESEVVPTLVLEIVSLTPGGEYEEKAELYTKVGVTYYIVYNPEYWQRDGHQPFEVYKLVNDVSHGYPARRRGLDTISKLQTFLSVMISNDVKT